MKEDQKSKPAAKKIYAKTALTKLLKQLEKLQQEAVAQEKKFVSQLEQVHPKHLESSKNLLHYLALRKHDIRELQVELSRLGLSSLGRSESHVLANLTAVRNQLQLLLGHVSESMPVLEPFPSSRFHLDANIKALLGAPSPGRAGRIMVTFAKEMADHYKQVRDLVAAGMNCARINCAHDDEKVWEKMVRHIKKAEKETGRQCTILFDLMGPKLRTGALKPGPKVMGIHPLIDELGNILMPAKVWLAPKGKPAPEPVDVALTVSPEWVNLLTEGSDIRFVDTRRRKRKFTVVQKNKQGALVHLYKSAYLGSGTELRVMDESGEAVAEKLGAMPAMVTPLILKAGQELLLHRQDIPGEPAKLDQDGNVLKPAHISCTLPEVFSRVKVGEPILFDDGEIEGEITEVTPDVIRVKITGADESGSKLRPDKGINLPESDLELFTLTEKDRNDLAFVVQHADVVNLSFVSHLEMVEELQQALQQHNSSHVGIMLKIETKAAFANLPQLLLTLMRNHPVGIMIARGDLAVELGWQRLAEVQEEILWIAEAAHLPVVWATQVLEKLTKKGRPSRAEITDAAMAQRADCVMLNKGTYILKSIALLDDIMKRMQQHQYKKTALLRMLHVSEAEGTGKG
ncbi:pyruvate kinase [Pontibacter akesuensis]|uniref:pyruvate kinase n=1 Tax=Pontibacter akesuensis TaxID=388950 RepID=A0A1I7FJ14_9BACT|nr:pyruvate kinase [Pontibacter akesuensis]GHA61999.1 pyruvate kinase [Pontibacter akesuensis]SFU36056.1 pyruvate kinase [Pontibacter akesuensis]